MGFWDNVKAKRIKMNYSQDDMAKKLSFKLGINMIQTGYGYYETGRAKKVSEDLMEAIAEILETSVEELAGITELTLERYPDDIKVWLGTDKATDWVMKAYSEYLASQRAKQ
jgi:transcriptional regulator with XRE-family HTH domain